MDNELRKAVSDFAKNSYGQELTQRVEFTLSNFNKVNNSISAYFSYFLPILKKCDAVLDAGCSRGFFSFSLPCKTIIGIDIDRREIDEANKRKVRKDAIYKVGDLYHPPKGIIFDAVLCSHVLEHIEDPSKLFSTFYNILKPGGKLLILTPNIFNPFYLINKIIPSFLLDKFKLFLKLPENRTSIFYNANTEKTLNSILIKNGYKKEELHYVLDIPITMKSIFYLNVWKLFHKAILFIRAYSLLPMIACVYKKND